MVLQIARLKQEIFLITMMYSKHHANSAAGAILTVFQTARLEHEIFLEFMMCSKHRQTARLERFNGTANS